MSPLVSLVTICALLVLSAVTLNVGRSRVKFGIKPPQMSGNPDFERTLRVQQNTLEQIVLFLPALWISAKKIRCKTAYTLKLVVVAAMRR